MSYTQWVSNGTNVSYVPKEKDTGEVITPFSTTASGGVPNSSYAPSTYVLAASGAWIPQTVGTSSSEVRRPTAYTLITSNGSPYFEATDTSLVYDSDTNHLTTNGRFELQGLSAQNDASFKFSSFQTKAQTWTSATLNISRNYASTRWTSGTEARYYLSTDGGTNWTLLLTDDYDNDPVTVTIFSHTLATSNPSSLSNYQVKVEIDAFSSGALGSVGVLDLQLYDIWIEGIYTVSGGSGTVTSITTTGANGVTISGGSTQTITTSGTFALALGNITPTSISTGTGSFSGDVEFAASIKSPNGSNSPIVISPDGTGDLHVNADSLRLGDNNADATIATNGTGDLILTTHEGSATQGIIRLYDGANGNITLTPNGTGQVQVGSDQVVTLTASQTLTNKTLSSSSTWNGNTIGVAYGGTGSTTLTSGSYVVGNGTSAVTLKTPTQVTADLDTFTYQIGATAGKKGLVPAAPAIGASVVYLDQTGSWTTPSGSGTTTNALTISSPLTGTSFNGSTAVTIALASGYGDTQNPYASKTANYFLAAPNGSAGVPTFRAIVAADIPTLNQSTTGNAATASALQTARNINGVSFNGTADITVTAAANTLTGTTLASGVTASSLTSVGTLTGLTVTRTTSGDTGTFTNTSTTNQSANVNAVSDNSTAISLRVFGSAAGSYGMLAANSTALYTTATSLNLCADNASGVIKFSTGSSVPERMRLDSSGNLGLGTASPQARLHVLDKAKISDSSQGLGLLALGDGSSTVNNVGIWRGEANSVSVAGNWLGLGGYQGIVFTTSNTSLGSQSERMRIDVNGNVGIGTSSPLGRLDVRAAVGSSPDSTIQNIVAIDTTSYGSGNGGGIGFGFVFNSGGSVIGRAAVIKGIKENATDGNYASALTFSTTQNSASTTERMRIDSNGNVGIGVTPSLPLHLYNSGAALAYFESTNANGPYVIWRSSGTSIGDVGSGKGISGLGNVTDFMIASRSTYPMILGTNSTERMRIDSSGNLGLGTASPAVRLNASITSAGEVARFETSSSSGTTYSYISTKTPSVTILLGADSSTSAGWVGTLTNHPLQFKTNDTERMRIDSSGNLLIGNTTGTEKLTVTGKIKASDVLLGNNGTKGYGAITTTTSTSTPTGGASGDHYYIY